MKYSEWANKMKAAGWLPVPCVTKINESPPWYLATKRDSKGRHPTLTAEQATEHWRDETTAPPF